MANWQAGTPERQNGEEVLVRPGVRSLWRLTLRPRLILPPSLALVLASCAWSYSFDLRGGGTGEVDRFLARCLPQDVGDARATGKFSIAKEIPRQQAHALRKVISKVKNGEPPSEKSTAPPAVWQTETLTLARLLGSGLSRAKC